MFALEINVKGDDFHKFEIIKHSEDESMFYTTQGGKHSPETKVKCILNNRLHIISMVNLGKCLNIDFEKKMTNDELKELLNRLNREASSNGVLRYELKIKGVISGIEEDSILFRVSQVIIMPASIL